ncbi:MAG: hypothetical protein AB2L11_11060 [Syntrophobacteraceae bacterium]
MMNDLKTIEAMRARMEPRILATNGVVMVSTGIGKGGGYCLKIGTSVPPDEVHSRLPQEIFQVPVEIEYLGKIEAQ